MLENLSASRLRCNKSLGLDWQKIAALGNSAKQIQGQMQWRWQRSRLNERWKKGVGGWRDAK